MKTSTLALIVVVCLVCGFTLGYFYADSDDSGSACQTKDCCDKIKDENPNCNFVEPGAHYIPEGIQPVTSLQELMLAFRAISSTDTIGFSVDTQLIKFMNRSIISDPNIMGFRLYPGLNGGVNKTIFIPFIISADGLRENASSSFMGFHRSIYSDGTGPCPNWCDNDSRVITRR